MKNKERQLIKPSNRSFAVSKKDPTKSLQSRGFSCDKAVFTDSSNKTVKGTTSWKKFDRFGLQVDSLPSQDTEGNYNVHFTIRVPGTSVDHPSHLMEFARIFGRIKDHSFAFAFVWTGMTTLSLSLRREDTTKPLPERQTYAVKNGTYQAALSPEFFTENKGLPYLASDSDIVAFVIRMELMSDIMMRGIDEIAISDDVLTGMNETMEARSRASDALKQMEKVSTDDSVLAPLKAAVEAMDQKISQIFFGLEQQFSDVLDLIADRI